MSLTIKQEQALKILSAKIENRDLVSVLQGVAGSGKTYTLTHLIESLGLGSDQVIFTAFTGAATRILQQRGLNAQTIHSLIYRPIIQRGVCTGFKRIRQDELSHLRLIIVDEFSMVSNEIMQDLMSFNVPLLLVGDSAQLPPMGQPNQFVNQADVFLDEVLRQALENPILWAATQIREGKPLSEGVHGDILLVGRKINLQDEWLRKDIQILCGTNNTRHTLNLKVKGNPEVALGDKIIFLRNDWKMGVVNGTIADIKGLSKRGRSYKLRFQDDLGMTLNNYYAYFQNAPIKKDQIFDWAYAITVHKAQGSTFDCGGLIIDESGAFREHSRNHLYTAITRFTGNHKVALLR